MVFSEKKRSRVLVGAAHQSLNVTFQLLDLPLLAGGRIEMLAPIGGRLVGSVSWPIRCRASGRIACSARREPGPIGLPSLPAIRWRRLQAVRQERVDAAKLGLDRGESPACESAARCRAAAPARSNRRRTLSRPAPRCVPRPARAGRSAWRSPHRRTRAAGPRHCDKAVPPRCAGARSK